MLFVIIKIHFLIKSSFFNFSHYSVDCGSVIVGVERVSVIYRLPCTVENEDGYAGAKQN